MKKLLLILFIGLLPFIGCKKEPIEEPKVMAEYTYVIKGAYDYFYLWDNSMFNEDGKRGVFIVKEYDDVSDDREFTYSFKDYEPTILNVYASGRGDKYNYYFSITVEVYKNGEIIFKKTEKFKPNYAGSSEYSAFVSYWNNRY